jgi:hypothetical protein
MTHPSSLRSKHKLRTTKGVTGVAYGETPPLSNSDSTTGSQIETTTYM